MKHRVKRVVLAAFALVSPLAAQPLVKTAIQVDPGNTKQAGQTFAYRLTYNCSSTSGPCIGARVVDLLPASLAFDSTVPASPTGDVAAINVTPNFGGSGQTRVEFVLISPLPAGNSGDLLINVHFPNGSTPNGTTADNTATAIQMGGTPEPFPAQAPRVTAVASVQTALTKTLQTGLANLDLPESYRLRIAVPSNASGALNLTAIGPVVDTLPPGTVFNGATPAADCQPGCVGTTPATVTWTSPCSLPLTPGNNCDVQVNVTFPSATFASGANVTNSFTTDATPLGQPSQNLGVGQVTHPVTTFVPAPGAGFSKNMAGGTPNPPTLNQTFAYDFNVANNGNVALDTPVIVDTLPVELRVQSVTTGAYTSLADFAAGEGVRVSYEKNTALGVFTLWGSSPNTTTNTTLTAPPPGLGAGEYLTRIRWELGPAQAGMTASTRPRVNGQIVNPDNAGGPVAFGDPIHNCAALSAVYTAGPTNVNPSDCETFTLSGPFVQLNPAKDNPAGGPFNPGQNATWRLHVRSAAQSSDPAPLDSLSATDLLPTDLLFVSWTFDDQGTGLPAPQNFQQIPNYAGTGRTLLRWSWNAGSGNLGVSQQVILNVSTTVRSGASSGTLSNTFDLGASPAGLSTRCSGSSHADTLDLDGDGNTAETLCSATGSLTVAGIAHLVSSKTVQGVCDGGFGSTSAGTLVGGTVDYRLRVQNDGTVPMQNFVLVDILPFLGDTGVRDTNPRGSQWTPQLAAPIAPPAGTTIHYSTSGNPCRGEVGGPVTGCDPPNWTTVAPDPIAAVRSFKVEFGDRVVSPFDFVEFSFHLTAPGDTPPAQPAFNSFAYQADRADGLGALAAEPQKVGVALGSCPAASLGDFVWVDVNHDGIQNDGPTGLDGVYVRLFQPGGDGVPGTFDDVPVAVTTTGTSPTSTAGWYRFPGLAPGAYFVCFTAPPTFDFTPSGLGTAATGSDANAASGCTPVVTLAANEDDPDVDAGLFATQLAALGNYVWFDRDGDGGQNESPWDGANGVTVRLFVDDGDGAQEPGTGDALVATTVTGDDVYGQPGYYLFDDLIPGLPYYVQFLQPASATGFTTQNAGGDDTVDSDAAAASGATQVVTLAPGEVNRTLDAGLVRATGTLALGDQVWLDANVLDNGVFEPQNGEAGIDGVRLDLYLDANADGQPTLDEYLGTTFTATQGGFAGRYRFSNLAPGNYLVVVDPASLAPGGALAGRVSSTGNDPAPDPDDDANGDDNGTPLGAVIGSHPVTLADNGEPTSEDGNNDTNLTVDFGFVPGASATQPVYDYGDAPDVTAGTAATDYNTTVLDNGAFHLLGVPSAPYLGSCVDADGGFNQDAAAAADDTAASAATTGTCAGGDDEDGVTFSGPFVPGSAAQFTVTAGGPTACVLNAWVDWNQNGIFGDAGEQIALDVSVGAAPQVLSPVVPASAVPGVTYARFRCSTSNGLGPVGPANDGEVEDYAVGVIGTDFGDAPASYGTQGAGAASHIVDPTRPLLLGSCVDTEADGQPNAAAGGDDAAAGTSRIGACFDDEDGVTFTSALAACQSSQLSVVASGAGALDAWIDFNGDGDFDDAGEQIFTSQAVGAGSNPLSFTVPCTAVETTTYARFRLSSTGGLSPSGAAPDGEVEDYALPVGNVDFGDAPDSYGTTLAAGGPNHRVVAGFRLGATEDSEAQGQPNVTADGDGADEDGVSLPPAALVACSTVNLSVALTNAAGVATPRLDAWIDFDGDGTFDDPRDRIASGLALASGANPVTVNVPCNARTAASYARFRLTSAGVAGPGGSAPDGEVEDYAVAVAGLDFGDAADPTYPTLLASNGARHAVLPVNNPILGSSVDTEADGQPNAAFSGDDGALTPDDEDGVSFPAALVPGADGRITLLAAGPVPGLASCWIDFNRDGDWADAGEHVVSDQIVGPSNNTTLFFPVPVGAPQGLAPTRCRVSTQAGLGVTGPAPDGEIEDHLAPIGVEQPAIGAAKELVSIVKDNSDVIFLVTFNFRLVNYGNVPLAEVNAVENLASTFTTPVTFTVVSLTSSDFTVNAGYDGAGNDSLLAPGNTLAIGDDGNLQLVVRVNSAGQAGPYTNQIQGLGTSPAGNPVVDDSQDGPNPDPNDDGNPGDNGVPTEFALPVSVILIPTLSEVGMAALVLALVGAAIAALRRR